MLPTPVAHGGEVPLLPPHMSPGGLGSDLAGRFVFQHTLWNRWIETRTDEFPVKAVLNSGPYSLGAVIGPLARTVADLKPLQVIANSEAESCRQRTSALRGM
jgi:hypothetical protein